ncbi:MAG TPA: hypothetical protein VGO40_14000 [Longimicrobium sp.]|nr:hypothetical protein [Longimicrobium sp.]
MSMDALHVSRFHARYRVPAADRGVRARLDSVLRDVLDQALETALARAGVSTADEVCIRAVHAPVRLGLGSPDASLAAAWSAALAGAIHATLAAGGDGAVRYGGRGHALAELVAGVARGDLRRAWAWRQLGLWRAGDAPSPAAAADEAAGALAAEPTLAVAALAAVARAGLLASLAPRIPADRWIEVARAALGAAGVSASAAAAILAPASPARPSLPPRADGEPVASAVVPAGDDGDAVVDDGDADAAGHPAGHPSGSAARRIARGSAILAAAAHVPAGARRALCALAVLEAEPGALRRPSAAALVEALAREVGDDDDARAVPRAHAETAGEREGTGVRRPVRYAPDPEADPADGDASRDRDPRSADGSPRTRGERAGRGDADASPSAANDVADPAEVGEDAPLADPRASGETRWGGLLFLLHLVEDLGLPEEVDASPVFAERTLRWVLSRVAAALLGLDAGEPAALAFAGLGPDRAPPTRGEPAATEDEARAVDGIAARLAAALHLRLGGDPADGPRAATAAVLRSCRRRATVHADPGWIDVRLGLDEVSVEVRRAGLDLDPGWLPWLGVAVRFVYA